MKNYLPKHKSDVEAVAYLKSLPFETVRADVPELLEWMQDMNWEVGSGVAKYLIPYVNVIKEELLNILNTNDEVWKYWILGSLIAHSSNNLDLELILKVKMIAEHPTEREIEEEVAEKAKEIIINNNW